MGKILTCKVRVVKGVMAMTFINGICVGLLNIRVNFISYNH